MPNAPPPPFLRGLCGDRAARRAAIQYWIGDTLRGALNVLLHRGLRLLPTDLCSAFGASQAAFCPWRFPDSDARARTLWERLRPEASSAAETDAAMRRLWRDVARTMAEYSVIDRFWREGRIAVEGFEHIEAAYREGRGVIVAGLHLSNWETVAAALGGMGHRVASTYEPPANRFEHAIVNDVRARYPVHMVYPDHDGGRIAHKLVSRRERTFIFYIDDLLDGEVSAPSFGRGVRTRGNAANVARLARITGAAVNVGYCTRLNDEARFRVTFTPPVAQVRSNDKTADLAANVAAIDRVITPIVTEHLDQWYYALDFEFRPFEGQ